MPEKPYRPCAGIMLLNREKKVFVGQRIDNPAPALQMPQGGIDAGETPEEAAMRELLEEIGTDKAEIIVQYPEPLDYDLPPSLAETLWDGKYKGQRQYWFLMRFTGSDGDIDLETERPEFSSYQWIEPMDLPHHAVAFKKSIYEKLVSGFRDYF
ncbi:MAG: RNA pyrophosphohydrolase [Pseudomonadota bacterium]